MKWVSALSTDSRLEAALDEAASEAERALEGERADLVVCFVSAHYEGEWQSLPSGLASRFGGAAVIGCSGQGVLGGGLEVEEGGALSITAARLPDIEIAPFSAITEGSPDLSSWSPELHRLESSLLTHVVLLGDPFRCDIEPFLQMLDQAFPRGVTVGGMASGAPGRRGNLLWRGDRVEEGGAVGVALRGAIDIETVVAQGCRPIGLPLFVTSCSDTVIHELDGQRPLEVVQELFATAEPEDRALFRHSLFVGVVMRPGEEEYGPGDFLVRNLLDIDPDSGAMTVGAHLEPGAVVQFHLRDAVASAEDLEAHLRRRSGEPPPAGALLFSCLGRGRGLYGVANHDSSLFMERFGAVPLGGFFCNGEIGPVQGRTFLHGYTSSFALFRSRC